MLRPNSLRTAFISTDRTREPTSDMPQYDIPEHAGPFRVIRSLAGTPLIVGGRKGRHGVHIPCSSWEQAEELCRRLNSGEHNGTVTA